MADLQKRCPACGFCESDFVKTLRMGCAQCYEVFEPELSTFLPKMHFRTTHVGKVPRSFSKETKFLVQELAEVERLLQRGVSDTESNQLLERWKQLALEIEAVSKSESCHHENS